MTLAQQIASNPYLKVKKCTDVADIEVAMDALRELDKTYGDNNKTLLKLWAQFIAKKKKITN